MNKRIIRKKNKKRKRPLFTDFSKILQCIDICDLFENPNYFNIRKLKDL